MYKSLISSATTNYRPEVLCNGRNAWKAEHTDRHFIDFGAWYLPSAEMRQENTISNLVFLFVHFWVIS